MGFGLSASQRVALRTCQRRQRRDPSFIYEVIIVDDGSPVAAQEIQSGTTTCALEFTRKHGSDTVRVLTLRQVRGQPITVGLAQRQVWPGGAGLPLTPLDLR